MIKDAEVRLYTEELVKYTEDCILEVETYLKKLFKNQNLKLAFRIYDGDYHISLFDFLQQHISELGEFRIYMIYDSEYDSLNNKFSYEDVKEEDATFLGGFSLDQLQGCCGAAVFFHSFIMPEHTNKGIGQSFVKLAKCICKDKDFSVMMCTDRIDNSPQVNIMNKLEFISHLIFKNRKTNNFVELRSTDLRDVKYYDLKCQKKSSIFQKFEILKKSVKKIFSTTTIKSLYLKNTLVNK